MALDSINMKLFLLLALALPLAAQDVAKPKVEITAPTESGGACPICDKLQARIAELEKQLAQVTSAMKLYQGDYNQCHDQFIGYIAAQAKPDTAKEPGKP